MSEDAESDKRRARINALLSLMQHPGWTKYVRPELEQRLAGVRLELEKDWPIEMTAAYRQRIRELRWLLEDLFHEPSLRANAEKEAKTARGFQ